MGATIARPRKRLPPPIIQGTPIKKTEWEKNLDIVIRIFCMSHDDGMCPGEIYRGKLVEALTKMIISYDDKIKNGSDLFETINKFIDTMLRPWN